jgi:tetratricopeptide (TPR) repeat protein
MLGGISAGRARAVVLHLLSGCQACNQVLLPSLASEPASELEALPPPSILQAYDGPIDRAFSILAGTWNAAERTPERSRREALVLLVDGGLEALVDAPSDLSGIPLFEALLERSWALRYEDPTQMVQLAHAAVLLASFLNEDALGAQRTADLCCRALTELANAYRVADELNRADKALGLAIEAFHRGTQEDLLGARFFTVFASQLAARRHFELACGALNIVAAACWRNGDDHLAGRALIMKGLFRGHSGKAQEAVLSIQQGLRTVDQARDPLLVVSATQSLGWFLADCGRFQEAQQALLDLRRRRLDVGGRITSLRLRWLEGHIQTGLGELTLAEEALREVRQGFEEAGLGYKAALAGLELGAVRFQQGDFASAEEIVLECADVFLSLRIGRELMASVLLVRQAAESRYLSLTSLRQVIDLLHKEERSPRARPQDEP